MRKFSMFKRLFLIFGVVSLLSPLYSLWNQSSEDLSPKYKKWLEEDVPYIISKGEKEVFLQLNSDREISTYNVLPEDLGLSKTTPEFLRGGSCKENADLMMKILSGEEKGARRDIVLLNSAGAFYVTGKAKDLKDGIELAESFIDSGKALDKINRFREFHTGIDG